MKIAVVAPMLVPVPPENAGGISAIVNELSVGFVNKKHEVALFCTKGSKIKHEGITVVETSPYPTMEYLSENRMWELRQFLTILSCQKEFDIIHFHYEPIIFRFVFEELDINILDFFTVPIVFTFHNPTDLPNNVAYYSKTPSLYRHNAVFVSNNQRKSLAFFPNSQVIYNAIKIDKFPLEKVKENYLLFLGRLASFKGILEAIAVAKKTKIKLIIIAKVEPNDREFYNAEVKQHIDGKSVCHLDGNVVTFEEKVKYLKNARCLLFPILWEEPFGLVMVEALACGTPVVAFRRGSVPEIIQDGINGFIVDNIDEMVEAVKKTETISPAKCRASVEKRFSVSRMVDEYEAVFEKIASKSAG